MTVITRSDLLALHGNLAAKAREIMTAKNQDYAHESDVFRNFRRYGTLGVLVRLSDKLARLDSFEENKTFAVADEKLEDTIIDLINYGIIYFAMKQEVKPKVDVTDGPYCAFCVYLADFLSEKGTPICSNCSAERDIDTTNWTLLGRL